MEGVSKTDIEGISSKEDNFQKVEDETDKQNSNLYDKEPDEKGNPDKIEETNKRDDSPETNTATDTTNNACTKEVTITSPEPCATKKTSEQVDSHKAEEIENEEETDSCNTKKTESKAGHSYKMEEDATSSKQEHVCRFEEKLIKPDIYLRKAKEQGWRSRSCFQLLQIDERFQIFEGVTRAVDLFASPGIWSQVLSRKLSMGETVYINDKPCLFYNELALHQKLERQEEPVYKENKNVIIVAVDHFGIPPYPGVIQIGGDLGQYGTSELILKQFNGNKVDLVVCGKMFDHTGLYFLDVNFQANHIVNVLYTTCNILKQGGTLVVAIFKETDNDLLKLQLSSLFKDVDLFRPKSCRASAKKSFAICRQYTPPEGFDPKLMGPYLDFFKKDFSSLTGINRIIIPFLTCGDTSAYPLSSKDEKMYKNKFTVPFSLDMPSSSQRKFKNYDLDHYMEKMNEAIKSIGLESDPDLTEMKMIKKKHEEGCSPCKSEHKPLSSTSSANEEEKNIYHNGPLYDLIQKTTKIKKFPSDSEPENVPIECGFQFLYEDESTDPNKIRECLEHVQPKDNNSTCTCDDFP